MQSNRTFVSYSRADGAFALRLASDLRTRGAEVWLDQLDIEAGTRWDSAIEDALRTSARILVLLSPKAVASQNVLDEMSFALDEGKTVVPVLVDACSVPMRLRRLQHVDFTRGYDTALTRLLATLGVIAGEPAPQAREPEPVHPRPDLAADAPFVPAASASVDQPSAGRSARVWWGGLAAAAVMIIALVALWPRGSGNGQADTALPSDTDAAASTAPPSPDATVSGPSAASPSDAEAQRPARETVAATAPPPAASSAGASGIGGLFNPSPPLKLPTGGDGDGLQVLLGATRRFAAADALTQADLEQLADAQSLACRGQSASPTCASTAQSYVESTLTSVCGRRFGARPSDQTGAARHDIQVQSCLQGYLDVMIKQMEREAAEAIRRIRAG